MQVEKLIQKLITEQNYDPIQTQKLAPKIEALCPDIRESLVQWVNGGSGSSPEYSGYSVDKILKAKPGMTTLAAYLTLDWIRRDPQTAIKAVLTPVMKFVPNKKK